ncbi:MAG TPA: AzlC family ABC transporter permease [Candidatus Monoglobus merdigallinarum]|uniref:AzlC family ABC transporter permease n=1 Tax=Candidatus Monoglobus merdigallinarum TaxID=2838698 RepID=A0A9D1TL32_9FIRM|nr:AzlC family ABC transporter permease [Candidatus Monoglobus merdigallinarum]
MDKSAAENRYLNGLRDGIPIGLGYLSVSFTFGIMAVSGGLPVLAALLISMTNLTSAGQLAGLSLILSGASYFEMAAAQLIINIRYSLMSVSVSQKLGSTGTLNRMGIAFGITDEIFAVSVTNPKQLGARYMYGLMCLPYIGWALGTLLGAAAGMLLPESIRSALGIAIYAMFIAIVIPPAKDSRPILFVLLGAVFLSSCFAWLPGLNRISGGFAIIICAVVCAAAGAAIAPIDQDDDSTEAPYGT